MKRPAQHLVFVGLGWGLLLSGCSLVGSSVDDLFGGDPVTDCDGGSCAGAGGLAAGGSSASAGSSSVGGTGAGSGSGGATVGGSGGSGGVGGAAGAGAAAGTGATSGSGGLGGLGGSSGAGATGGMSGAGGAGGAGGVGGSGATTGCVSKKPPLRPSTGDAGSQVTVFALKDVFLDQNSAWVDVGFNLDDLCTDAANPVVECSPPISAAAELDGPGGVDNVLGHRIVPLLLTVDPDAEQSARDSMDEGRGAIVLRVANYNGLDDDFSVDVWIAQSLRGTPQSGVSGAPLLWDGTDSLFLEDAAFIGSDLNQPVVKNDNAYVSNRTLVVRLPDRVPMAIKFSDGALELILTDATITGDISADGRFLDDVVLAGRWGLAEVGSAASVLGICPGTFQRTLFDNLINTRADVRSTPGTGGPGATCDALSIGLGFRGYPAQLGGLDITPTPPPVCGAGGAGGASSGGAGGSAGSSGAGAGGTAGSGGTGGVAGTGGSGGT